MKLSRCKGVFSERRTIMSPRSVVIFTRVSSAWIGVAGTAFFAGVLDGFFLALWVAGFAGVFFFTWACRPENAKTMKRVRIILPALIMKHLLIIWEKLFKVKQNMVFQKIFLFKQFKLR